MRVHGEGPRGADLMFVGEGPGYYESLTGRPFSSGGSRSHTTGDEITGYLDGVTLPCRQDVFLTNIYREYHGKEYEYTAADLARDEPDLLRELRMVNPAIIVCLGRHSARWFLGDVDIDGTHGLAWALPEIDKLAFLRHTVVFVCTHPAAGLHNPNIQAYVSHDFAQLAVFLRGDMPIRRLFHDPFAGKETYVEITDPSQIVIDPTKPLTIDTEGYPWAPWSIQYSQEAGVGYLIRHTRCDGNGRRLSDYFAQSLLRHCPRLVFHHALHDLRMMQIMGLPTDLSFDDTMIMAYLLNVEPKGLKPLCARHCGMIMASYDDILGDVGNRLAIDYLLALWDIEGQDWEDACQEEFVRLTTTPYTDARGRVKPGRKLRKPPVLPRSALFKSVERCLGSEHPRTLWQKQDPAILSRATSRASSMPEPTLDHIPFERALRYACRDADGTHRLAAELRPQIAAHRLTHIYDLERGTYPMILRMMQVGMLPDLSHFAALSVTLGHEINRLQSVLAEQTGQEDFNANSGDQVAAFLFDELGLDGLKRTKSRQSTNDKILEALEHTYPDQPVISTVRAFRETYKLKHTFVDQIPDFCCRWPHDGRIHTTLRTTSVVSGRLSSADPNMLAQPEHGTFADDFKRGWIASPGHVLASWDESQVELRGLAHLSQDPVMLAVYRGERRNPDGSLIDLHAALGERIFGIKPKDQDKSKHRLPMKELNFGIPNGMTAKGLMISLRKVGQAVDEDDAQRWLDETLSLYVGVRRYQQERIAFARTHGYVRCLSGRIRYVGGLHSKDDRIREAAERLAFSTPIQEGAQWVLKQAEIRVWHEVILPLQAAGRWIEPLLQVHDSLKLEMDDGLQFAVNDLIQDCMTCVPQSFSVPLAVTGEWGPNMRDMEPFDATN